MDKVDLAGKSRLLLVAGRIIKININYKINTMGQKIYYHNITKNEYNINDFGDAVEQADKNDIIKLSERGCAIMYDIRKKIEDESNDLESTRNNFYKYFEEFHEENFDIETGS